MSNAAPILPPDLPTAPTRKHSSPQPMAPSAWLAWCVIVASIVFIAWSANQSKKVVETTTPGLVTASEASELAMLKLQGRYAIGVAGLNPMAAEQVLDQLDGIAKTTRGKIAVAIIRNFIDSERGVETLEAIDSPENEALINEFKTALTDGVTNEARADLKKQVGWFASLLRPAEGVTSSVPPGQIKAESTKVAVVFAGGFTALGLAWLAGLGILIFGIVCFLNRTLKPAFTPSEASSKGHIFVEAFAIYLGLMALGGWLGDTLDPRISIASYAVSFLLGLFWPKIRGVTWKETRALLGLHRGQGIFKEIGAGFLGYLVLIVIASIGLLLTMALILISNLVQGGGAASPDASHPIVGMLDGSNSLWGKLSLFALAAILAPLLEETMFRGALHRHLRHRWGFWISALFGGFIFAVIHPQGIFAVPALTAMGFGFGIIREWRDSLIASMTAHALNNGIIVCVLLIVMG